jgi:2-isopropylmalate synthase
MSTSAGSSSRGRSESDRILIFDTTLRDGEQSPGISLNKTEKLEIAHQLARLGVDVIEAGFPITSPGDFESVQAIAREVEGPVICGLARTVSQDIEAVWNAVRDAERPRIHMVIATSDIHIKHKLQTTREDVKGQVRAAVAQAREYTDDVEFSTEDGSRSDVQFLAEVIQIALDEGATTINVADTVESQHGCADRLREGEVVKACPAHASKGASTESRSASRASSAARCRRVIA